MSVTAQEVIEEHKAFLHGLFTTALEGGIGYWSACSKYRWATDQDGRTADLDNFIAVIEPAEGDCWGIWEGERDEQPLTINLEVMARGARLMHWYVQGIVDGQGKQVPLLNVKPWPADHYHWQYVEAYISNGQRGDYDAGTADMVVQFGLFGEVVYG